jgi:hypothetical protein
MPATPYTPPTPDELGAMIKTLVARIKATIGDYPDATVYPNDNGVSVSVMDEESIWTHEWEITRVAGRPMWEVKHTISRTGYYDSADDLINQIGEALPDADEDES